MICKAVALFLYIFYGWFNLCAHSARRVDEFTVIIPETSETCNVELKYGVGYSYRQLDEEYGIYSLSACVHLCKRKYFNCAAVDFDRQRNVCISLKRATDDTTPYMRSSGDFAVITYCSKGTRSEMFGRRTTDFDFYNSDTTTPSYSSEEIFLIMEGYEAERRILICTTVIQQLHHIMVLALMVKIRLKLALAVRHVQMVIIVKMETVVVTKVQEKAVVHL
ncbi:hypothetical protein T05_8902 [Trichinella murrelli]|uniref:Apple domain-containing protein n=1 Tax=Trichinella murrelli TaxID=144512 RepID=A0A0V0U014_9BILA|nr:hypothetical protein T05_8902 [Trichinella murrelli]